MIKVLRISLFYLLFFSELKADSVEDCRGFKDLKKTQCSSLGGLGGGIKCFNDSECKDKYDDCGSSNPKSKMKHVV